MRLLVNQTEFSALVSLMKRSLRSGGDGSGCAGCDGVENSGLVLDQCAVVRRERCCNAETQS